MIICYDNPDYAALILGEAPERRFSTSAFGNPSLVELAASIFGQKPVYSSSVVSNNIWQYLFMVETAAVSQYDVVVELCQRNIQLPHGLLCLAGSGEKFHGLRRRSWAALPGNIHLTAHLVPNLRMAESGIGFTIIAALSVVDAIDKIEGLKGRAMIKWVNDIFIDGAKVSGFLTHTLSLDGLISSAVIGIGLNVEATPPITPDRFISRAISLWEIVSDPSICDQRLVFEYLTEALERNYQSLASGRLPYLLDRYRERSIIIGREVEIVPDSPGVSPENIVRGQVTAIGDNLELYLKNREKPITRGRLVLIN